ncbi:acyl-CoA dehydrogenase family protein [Qipengyuania sp. JC766]|uniref:acyl-CoA dehydrogenase family protein n=1 Tax=Qipengyuania sp. JC766 TaxID=3232139 RepID=UPI00345A9ABD
MERLADAGWLRACLPKSHGGEGWGTDHSGTHKAFDALRTLGRANLSVARLFEGHMNAVKLVFLYASDRRKDDVADAVSAGLLLGVWGADDPDQPLRFAQECNHVALSGAKRFASGLGLVGQAVVTVETDAGQQMLLVPTDNEERADPTTWVMAGMRATRSGRYAFDSLQVREADLLGTPGDLLTEPYFEGGIWRYCAAHLGAAEALYALLLDGLAARDRAEDRDQQRRIVDAATAIETARLWLLRAADEVERDGAQPVKAALSLLARQVTEDACREVLYTAERALGMAVHVEGSAQERIARDLRLFLCQAAPDAKRVRAARALVERRVRPEEL